MYISLIAVHCWDYRRLIINKIGISLEDEIQFSTDRINVDFSNYSSWHYRSTLRTLDKESLDAELNLVQNAVFTDPNDSSAWFYLKWVLSNSAVTSLHRKNFLEALDQLLELEPECKCKCKKSIFFFLAFLRFWLLHTQNVLFFTLVPCGLKIIQIVLPEDMSVYFFWHNE